MPFIGNTPELVVANLSKQDITGNGSTTYSLDYPVRTAADIEVFVNNVRQEPDVAYTVGGQSVVFANTVSSSDSVYVVFQGKTVASGLSYTALANTVNTDSIVDDAVTENKIVDGAVTENKIVDGAVTKNKITYSPGDVVKTQQYNSGYGTGARTQVAGASTSGYTIAINGTGNDGNRVPGLSIFTFTKTRSDTELRIRASVPCYVQNGGSGVGLRVQISIDSPYTVPDDYNVMGLLANFGMAHGWGALGYGGNSAGIININQSTEWNSSSIGIREYTGEVRMFFQGSTWASGDTATWIDFNSSYPKYAEWTIEEYIPVE